MKNFKRILCVALAVIMVTMVVAGCKKKNQTKGQVIIGTDTEANGDWAYALSSNNATDMAVIQLTDDCSTVVTNFDGDYIWNDKVVKSHTAEVAADGKKTYTIEINKGLVFNNGEKITAENFRIRTLFANSKGGEEIGASSSAWDMLPGGKEYREGTTNKLAGIRLLGDYKFSVTILPEGNSLNELTGEPTQYLPYYYDITYAGFTAANTEYWFGKGWSVKDDGDGAYMYNKDAEFTAENVRDQFTKAQFATSDRVTAGPYNLVSYDKSAYEITLEANPLYNGDFQGRMPSIQKIIIVKTEDDTVIDNLTTGGVEIYSGIADGALVNAALDLIDTGKFKGSYTQYDRAGYGYFSFGCDFGPTQWKEFRQAVAYLLDRNEFAKTFCEGWGSVVHGPYCPAFSMYADSREFLAENLNTYDKDPSKSVELLKAIGFTLNADGTPYVDGSGQIRYKEVTEEEAKYYDDLVVKVNGKILMPAVIKWASSGNSVAELLSTMLVNGDDIKNVGIEIRETQMDFPTLLNYLYRQDVYGLGGDFTVPTYNMFNLATGFNGGAYDQSLEVTTNPAFIADGYNTPHIFDAELEDLAKKMVYGVEEGDYDTYLSYWQKFIVKYNDLLPLVPLYSNIYVSVYPNTIENYKEGPFWGYERAILYADYVG